MSGDSKSTPAIVFDDNTKPLLSTPAISSPAEQTDDDSNKPREGGSGAGNKPQTASDSMQAMRKQRTKAYWDQNEIEATEVWPESPGAHQVTREAIASASHETSAKAAKMLKEDDPVEGVQRERRMHELIEKFNQRIARHNEQALYNYLQPWRRQQQAKAEGLDTYKFMDGEPEPPKFMGGYAEEMPMVGISTPDRRMPIEDYMELVMA